MTGSVAVLLLATTTLNSCIGSFALTNKVINWNKQVGNKFVNELVFFAFWILPVYEVTAIADMIVINSIEFWSGNNPLTASTKVVDSDHGRYLVECDGKGYTIKHEETGQLTRLDFDVPTQTWSIVIDGNKQPFLTWLDDGFVKVPGINGKFERVELSEAGVLAYQESLSPTLLTLGATDPDSLTAEK